MKFYRYRNKVNEVTKNQQIELLIVNDSPTQGKYATQIIIKPYQMGLSRIDVETTYLFACPVYMIKVNI